jgi:hypothetical protein
MNKQSRLLRRREAVLTLAGLGLTGALGARASGVLGAPAADAAATCVLSPEVTEGPYWIDTELTGRDITEDRPGLPLELVLTVQHAKTCTAIKGADVEIWHSTRSASTPASRAARPAPPAVSTPRRPTPTATCAATRRPTPTGACAS